MSIPGASTSSKVSRKPGRGFGRLVLRTSICIGEYRQYQPSHQKNRYGDSRESCDLRHGVLSYDDSSCFRFLLLPRAVKLAEKAVSAW
jgi:hypothetical protein